MAIISQIKMARQETKPRDEPQGFACFRSVLGKFLRFAEVPGTDRASAAAFTEMLCRSDQFDEFFGIGFNKTLFFQGT